MFIWTNQNLINCFKTQPDKDTQATIYYFENRSVVKNAVQEQVLNR